MTEEEVAQIIHCLRKRVAPANAEEGLLLVQLGGRLRVFFDEKKNLKPPESPTPPTKPAPVTPIGSRRK